MKIVVLDGHALNPGDLSWQGFEPLGDLTVYERTEKADIPKHIGNAEIVLLNKAAITPAILEACPNLQYIGVLATGYNVVDVVAAKEKGVIVTNIPAYGTDAVAQFTFALLLELVSRVAEHSQAVHDGEWTRCRDFCFWKNPLMELAGKTMGIIGFGRIGQATAIIARAFGMKVLAHAPRPTEEGRQLAEYVSLEELLAQSDIISLHCPLFPETRGMINRQSIAKMKDGVLLINTSRGPLIVEEDLAEALNSGKIAGAGVDVVNAEPIRADNPLLQAKNCLITPHIAWGPTETRARLMEIAVENLRRFLAGDPVNVVNP